MINFNLEIKVPPSGWVPNVGIGTKCQHGNYIPETQEDQTYAMHCDICNALRAFIERTGQDLETIYKRQRDLWTRLEAEKEE